MVVCYAINILKNIEQLKTINMYNYEQHFIDMVSNCCGDSMEEMAVLLCM